MLSMRIFCSAGFSPVFWAQVLLFIVCRSLKTAVSLFSPLFPFVMLCCTMHLHIHKEGFMQCLPAFGQSVCIFILSKCTLLKMCFPLVGGNRDDSNVFFSLQKSKNFLSVALRGLSKRSIVSLLM